MNCEMGKQNNGFRQRIYITIIIIVCEPVCV